MKTNEVKVNRTGNEVTSKSRIIFKMSTINSVLEGVEKSLSEVLLNKKSRAEDTVVSGSAVLEAIEFLEDARA